MKPYTSLAALRGALNWHDPDSGYWWLVAAVIVAVLVSLWRKQLGVAVLLAGATYLSLAHVRIPGIVCLLGRDPGRLGSLEVGAAGMECTRQAPHRFRAGPRLVGFPGTRPPRSPGRNALAGDDPLRGPGLESLLFIRRPDFPVWTRRLLVVPRTGQLPSCSASTCRAISSTIITWVAISPGALAPNTRIMWTAE